MAARLLVICALVVGAPAPAAAASRLVEVPLSGPPRVIAEPRLGFEALRVLPAGDAALAMEASPARDGTRVRYRVDLATGRRTRLAVTREGRGSFSPDGTRVFAETVPVESGAAVLRTIGGRRLRTLRPGVADLPISATWSPDSRRLFVVDQQDVDRRVFRLRVIDARTGALRVSRRVTGEPLLARESSSPMGDRLAVAVMRPRTLDRPALILTPASGRRVALAGVQATPAWSPDGRRIAVPGEAGIDVLDAGSGALERRIATPGAAPDELTWSADSGRVAYVMRVPGLAPCPFCGADVSRTGLAIAHVEDGRTETLLAQADHYIDQPAWTPDGQALIATCRSESPPC